MRSVPAAGEVADSNWAGDEEDVPYFGADRRPLDTAERGLRDFTATPALLGLVPLALVIGVLGASISLALLGSAGSA